MSARPAPSALVASAVERYGVDVIRDWCGRLVLGESLAGEAADPDIALLGGQASWPAYWFRVWGIRAFRYLGEPPRRVLEHALRDDAWRVREHALAIVLGEAAAEFLPAADAALEDAVPRVRAAAVRVVTALGEVEHAEHLQRMGPDALSPEDLDRALSLMAARLDRPL